MTPRISVRKVAVTYTSASGATIDALGGVDLDVGPGEFISLIGPSGCGKSTLLNVIGGLQPATSGSIEYDGVHVKGPQPDKVSFVFQDYSLLPWRNVLANTELGLQIRGVGRAERRERARHYLRVVGLDGFLDAYPGELSGGMQQRVALARSLAQEPEIVLMDEPFGALDEQTRMALGEEVSSILANAEMTTVFVTHSLGEAVYLADRVVVMSSRPGRITRILTVDEERPRKPTFMTSSRFNELRSELFDLLHDEYVAAATASMRGEVEL